MERARPRIRVGPAGWSYADWNGIVYPARRPPDFHEAAYLAEFFDTIEINTSFYHPPRPESVAGWVRRVERNKDFKFTAKLWQRFTHDRNASRQDEKVFKEGLIPLMNEGRLGALLAQFPWSFKNTPENREYVGGLRMQFVEYPLALEVRHSSWNRPEVLEMLAELNVGFCNIDQPVIGRSIGPSEHSTSPVGYVRLHGRPAMVYVQGAIAQRRRTLRLPVQPGRTRTLGRAHQEYRSARGHDLRDCQQPFRGKGRGECAGVNEPAYGPSRAGP